MSALRCWDWRGGRRPSTRRSLRRFRSPAPPATGFPAAAVWSVCAVCAVVAALLTVSPGAVGEGQAVALHSALRTSDRRVVAVAAENEYANVVAQIGGPFVAVTAIMSDPNTDPHTFEPSPKVARLVASARLVVQNGLGYDTFMTTMESALPGNGRRIIDVQHLLRRPSTTPNPHLWYSPQTMPAVATAVERDLAAIEPAHRAAFARNLRRFRASLRPWKVALAVLRSKYKGTAVATTEPVADDLLVAAGIVNKTPISFQADIMNGVDPSPQALAAEQNLLAHRKVRAFVYNVQVTDTVTQSLLALARRAGVPVVGVYETMPTPGYDYQRWMLAEVQALADAFAHGVSAPKL